MTLLSSTPSPPALAADSIRCGYAADDVLHGVSFALEQGEFLAVIGPNGSGKSTLVRAVTRLLPLRGGRVEVFGQDLTRLDRRRFAQQVAVSPQRSHIEFRFTVEQVVAMGRTPHLGRFQSLHARDHAAIVTAMEEADVLELRHRFVDELSGGEFQRVIVARALAQQPRLLLLDEPTSHLDINHAADVFDLLRRLNREQGLTVLCISHDLNAAALYADRLLLLAEGRVLGDGPPDAIVTEESIRRAYGAAAVVGRSPVADRPQASLVPRQ